MNVKLMPAAKCHGPMNLVNNAMRSVPVWLSILLGLLIFSNSKAEPEAPKRPEQDPSNIVGPEECGECHKAEVHVWRETRHAKTFKVLMRTKQAKEIASNMGIKRVKKASACVSCHFTSGYKRSRVKAIAGISCESCHSPAKDWIKVHGDYGGKNVTRGQETLEHKAERLARIKEAGMIRPGDLYHLAANCYRCHIVPDEKLVNVGGHGPGSDDFELVSWSLGEIRHKFLSSEGKKNEAVSPERQRMLYVVGKALDLEYGLRALANATEEGTYATETTKRVRRAVNELRAIDTLVPIPEVQAILGVVTGMDLQIGNGAALKEAAGTIAAAIRELANARDSAPLTALDEIIPRAGEYKGKPGGPPERVAVHDLPSLAGRLNR